MTTVEIRHEIVQRLFSTEDKNLLQKILELLPVAPTQNADWWDDLTEEEQRFLDESAAAADRGEVIAHEAVMKNMKALLRGQQR
ncbi:MAG TPA: hypothetical protein PK228_22540 [Saprospiraceae bacterium]|nr:hypothetical protein [Saprospiraceae bacterium]